MSSRTTFRMSLFAACVVFQSSPVLATMPNLDVLQHATMVPNDELSSMRGRFIAGGKVQFFGLQLYTVWQTGDGMVMSTAISLGVNFGGGGAGAPADTSVTAHFFNQEAPKSGLDEGEPLTTPVPLPSSSQSLLVAPDSAGAGGLEGVEGIVQSIQLAGDFNGASNQIRIDVVPSAAGISPLSPSGPLGDSIQIAETTVTKSETGVVQSAILEADTLGVSVEVPQEGIALQRIRGSELSQIAQHVRLTGSFNEITNLMQLSFEIGTTNAATQANILSALQALRGLQ